MPNGITSDDTNPAAPAPKAPKPVKLPAREKATPSREVAVKAVEERAERSQAAVEEFLAARRLDDVEDTPEEAEARVREELTRLWPSA